MYNGLVTCTYHINTCTRSSPPPSAWVVPLAIEDVMAVQQDMETAGAYFAGVCVYICMCVCACVCVCVCEYVYVYVCARMRAW